MEGIEYVDICSECQKSETFDEGLCRSCSHFSKDDKLETKKCGHYMCGEDIYWNGEEWKHCGDAYRHKPFPREG